MYKYFIFPYINKPKPNGNTPLGQHFEVFQHCLSTHSYSYSHVESSALMFYFPSPSLPFYNLFSGKYSYLIIYLLNLAPKKSQIPSQKYIFKLNRP